MLLIWPLNTRQDYWDKSRRDWDLKEETELMEVKPEAELAEVQSTIILVFNTILLWLQKSGRRKSELSRVFSFWSTQRFSKRSSICSNSEKEPTYAKEVPTCSPGRKLRSSLTTICSWKWMTTKLTLLDHKRVLTENMRNSDSCKRIWQASTLIKSMSTLPLSVNFTDGSCSPWKLGVKILDKEESIKKTWENLELRPKKRKRREATNVKLLTMSKSSNTMIR